MRVTVVGRCCSCGPMIRSLFLCCTCVHLCRVTAPKPSPSYKLLFRQGWCLSYTVLPPPSAATIAAIIYVCVMHELAYRFSMEACYTANRSAFTPKTRRKARPRANAKGLQGATKQRHIYNKRHAVVAARLKA